MKIMGMLANPDILDEETLREVSGESSLFSSAIKGLARLLLSPPTTSSGGADLYPTGAVRRYHLPLKQLPSGDTFKKSPSDGPDPGRRGMFRETYGKNLSSSMGSGLEGLNEVVREAYGRNLSSSMGSGLEDLNEGVGLFSSNRIYDYNKNSLLKIKSRQVPYLFDPQQAQQARAQAYYKMLVENEGDRDYIYLDTSTVVDKVTGKTIKNPQPTTGIGFNLNAAHNKKFLKENNIDIRSVRVVDSNGITVRGGRNLTQNEKLLMYNHSLRQAFKDARLYDPRFDQRPESVQMGLVDMAFMGLTRLKKFVKMKEGLDDDDYAKVAKEAEKSKWFKDVKTRGPRTVALFKKAIYPEGWGDR